MSQYGAYGYALHGLTYKQILSPLLPGDDARPAADEARPRAARTRRASLVVVVVEVALLVMRRGAGKTHKLLAGTYTLRARAEARAQADEAARQLRAPLLFSPGAAPLALGGRGYRGALG